MAFDKAYTYTKRQAALNEIAEMKIWKSHPNIKGHEIAK